MNARLRVAPLAFGAALAAASFIPGSAAASQSGGAWPEMLGDQNHSSYSTDSKISISSKFGIKWMANLYNSDMGSPVVAYNTALGRTVVYVANERADVFALSAATGHIIWSTNVGVNDKIEDTPVVASDGSVFVGTSDNPTLYKLNGATGAIECSAKANLRIDASPLVATPPGGQASVFWAWVDSPTVEGKTEASSTANCRQIWSFDNWIQPKSAGEWASPAYGLDATGEPLIFAGTADSDSTEYAIDAVTGKRVWYYRVYNPPPAFYDIGDASTVSPPGKNGLSDGALYVNSKYGIEYGLDETTGALLWQFTIAPGTKAQSSRSSAALDGNQLVFGYGDDSGFSNGGGGVYSLNAVNGNENWQWVNPNSTEVLSSPAIIGAPGSEIVTFGDIGGAFSVLNLASGKPLYTYQTGGYITSSPAEADGAIYIASSDGFLYAFAPSGGNGPPPSSAVTYPKDDSEITNPNGTLTVTGTASDKTGVNNVEVAVQMNGSSGPWYNAATGKYNEAPIRNQAALTNQGGTSTKWSFQLPAPASGGTFTVFASAVNTNNIVNKSVISAFTIDPSKGEPNVTVSSSYVAPGATFEASANGFKPGETVQFSLFGKVVATAVASKTGHVADTKVAVSQDALFGPTSLTLTGKTSGKSASATIDITNNWTQGAHDAVRSGNEPHDPDIERSTSVGNGSVLNQSWYYQAGAAVNSSPTVVDGVAYFGNDAGALSAVVVNTGAPEWTYTDPAGASIRTAPAVDSKGNAIVGDVDGNLYWIKGGSLSASLPIGGNLTSPAVDDGDIYIASDSGKLVDVSDKTDTITWTASLAGAGHSAPAYDAVNNIVVAGDDSGAVTAFNSATGTQLWQVKTGGKVVANPVIWKGVVYIGSADQNFYAVKESNGTVEWKNPLSGPVTAGAAILGGTVWIGDMNGQAFGFSLTGALQSKTNTQNGSGIIGVSTVEGNTFVTMKNGEIGMIRPGGPVPFGWSFQTNSTLSTAPAIVDGTVYVGAADGGVYAFTPQGANPESKTRKPVISITDSNAWSCSTP